MKRIDAHGFERKFQDAIDPWNYRTSRFEAMKRRALLRACGPGSSGRVLELACAIGETSRALAPRCLRLVATDFSPTALAEARRLTPPDDRIVFVQGLLPRDVPRGPFDLVVVSEIAYYLTPRDLALLARRLMGAVAPGGRIVVLHHLKPFDDAAQLPILAQARLGRALATRMIEVFRAHHGRFEVFAYRRPVQAAA